MKAFSVALILSAALAATGCGKKDEAKSTKASDTPAAKSASGLAWTPENYDKMSAACKKALACCLDKAVKDGAKGAEDFNLKCSGPAMWQDDGCETDRKARVAGFEAASTPVPDACK
jgi:hypothetical protein